VDLPHHQYIAAPRDWQVCLESLQSESRLAIDLEANSMHAYQERVCLIQVSNSSQDYIIDPLTQLDLDGFGALLANPEIEKVFHAAEYDLTLLKREYGWELNNLFDTMWSARILGYKHYGLSNLLEQLYQVKLNKRYQKSNWCRRPLSLAQRIYAQLDTHYLLQLRDHMAAELETAGRIEEAKEIFEEQTRVKPSNHEFSPDSFWSINGVHSLTRRQQAVLRALAIYRDEEAKRHNKPHFKILGNRTLLELAEALPRDVKQLRRIHGMTAGQIRRHGKQLLEWIAKGKEAPLPTRPKRNKRPPDSVMNRYDKLHRWRKARAKARGVESDVIVSRDALWAIARANPRTPEDLSAIEELGAWRTKRYGQDLLNLLKKR
jgi:ribonuclease D